MNWVNEYRSRRVAAAEAVKAIQSGMQVWIHPGSAEPQGLVRALIARAGELENVKVAHLLTLGVADYVQPQYSKAFRHVAFFIGDNVREAVNNGRADFMPVFLSEIPALLTSGALPIDVALIQVSPPDEHGFCSYGVGVDCTKAAAENAGVVIAQVNEKMPRTLGDSFIHLNKIDAFVESEEDILELGSGQMSEVERAIGEHVASLIEDGSTLQMGIGGIPNAVLSFLGNKSDLGIHTEMFSDGVKDLFENGIITGEKKTLHRGKIVASFLMGSRKLFDFVDNNPVVEMHPTQYANDPFVISQNTKMISVNSALEVDLTGQVCADSIGRLFYSGFGGQLDFVRGAARSPGGKPIIALPSTAKNWTISRIAPQLLPGAGVVTTRGDVHYVVTEYGIAYLHGKTIRQRAESLIAIAHPDFRADLRAQAVERRYI